MQSVCEERKKKTYHNNALTEYMLDQISAKPSHQPYNSQNINKQSNYQQNSTKRHGHAADADTDG